MTTLIIAEKPTSAKRIAEALAEDGRPEKRVKRGVAYYVFFRDGEKHCVVPSVGHLYGLAPAHSRWDYPVFDIAWKERCEIDPKAKYVRAYLANIKELAQEADRYINASDYDIEGATLGYNILRFACGVEDAGRMRYSTLVRDDLIRAYENASPTLDWDQINAGIARHYLDFYWGVNLTRALTLALNKAARLGFKILSTGRVQAPTLAILAEREKEIESFKPTPFWQIRAEIDCEGHLIEGWFERDRLWEREEAERVVKGCEGRSAVVASITRRRYRPAPPTPLSLTDLQVEAYRAFGFTPDRALNIAQSLYEMAAISYPRTASQKLPPQIGYRAILSSVASLRDYRGLAEELLGRKKLKPKEGRKKDPAHVAIYPTTEPPKKLTSEQSRLYDLIVRRFMATFGRPAVRESMKVAVRVGDFSFIVTGRRTIEENWYRFYKPYVKLEETPLPDLKEGQELTVRRVELIEKQTQPPKRYTPASLVRELESRGIGTKATRAEIIRTLFNRGYIKGRSIRITELGRGVVNTLRLYCPRILSEELTREFERKMDLIMQGKLNVDRVLDDCKAVLKDILAEFRSKEEGIGEYLAREVKKAERPMLGPCPRCGDGVLLVVYSRRTRRRFVGCTGYFKKKCSFTLPLPQRGKLDSLGDKCKGCGYPIVMIQERGRRPWRYCINPDCPTKNARRKG